MKRINVIEGTFYPGDLTAPGTLPWVIIDAAAAVPTSRAGRQPISCIQAEIGTVRRWPYQFLGVCWRP